MKKFNILFDFPLRYHQFKASENQSWFYQQNNFISRLTAVNKKFCENMQKVENQDGGERCIKTRIDVVCQ